MTSPSGRFWQFRGSGAPQKSPRKAAQQEGDAGFRPWIPRRRVLVREREEKNPDFTAFFE